MIDIIALLIICYVQYHVWKINRSSKNEKKPIGMILIMLALCLPGCSSFGLTPGYVEKHPNLLENVRHFYSEPLWTRRLHCDHERRCR